MFSSEKSLVWSLMRLKVHPPPGLPGGDLNTRLDGFTVLLVDDQDVLFRMEIFQKGGIGRNVHDI